METQLLTQNETGTSGVILAVCAIIFFAWLAYKLYKNNNNENF